MQEIIKEQVVIYSNNNGDIEVRLKEDSVWLNLKQMSLLFSRDKSVISRHLKNIFQEGELTKEEVVVKNATTGDDGKTYQVEYYNLDVIISVGYRVNSRRGIEFRKWAAKILKEYLLTGYSLNHHKLVAERITELKGVIDLLSTTLLANNLIDDTGKDVLAIVSRYSSTWTLLVEYDENNLAIPDPLKYSTQAVINYDEAIRAINLLKKELGIDASNKLFALERDRGLQAIIGNICQTFAGAEIYKTVAEKAAHLLYFIIKDHPFNDGNKRIGSFLFLVYLNKAGIKHHSINASSMTALALLVAQSDPSYKDIIIKLVINLINN